MPLGDFIYDYKFEELNDYLQSHCQKKNSVNAMAEANIPMNAMIFCCEWDTNSLHTILSYVFKSMSNYMGCGKTLAHWNYKVSSDVYGGIPPTLYDI